MNRYIPVCRKNSLKQWPDLIFANQRLRRFGNPRGLFYNKMPVSYYNIKKAIIFINNRFF